jgi:hypothetical protein
MDVFPLLTSRLYNYFLFGNTLLVMVVFELLAIGKDGHHWIKNI